MGLNIILIDKTGKKEKMKIAQNRTKEIVGNDNYWKLKFKQLNFVFEASINSGLKLFMHFHRSR